MFTVYHMTVGHRTTAAIGASTISRQGYQYQTDVSVVMPDDTCAVTLRSSATVKFSLWSVYCAHVCLISI